MNTIVSEDALRRALERIGESTSAAWMRPALMHLVREALDRPWVLGYRRQHPAVVWPPAGRRSRLQPGQAGAGQATLYLTPLHGKAALLKSLIAPIHAALQHVKAAAEQIKTTDRWAVLLRHVRQRIAPLRPPQCLPATA